MTKKSGGPYRACFGSVALRSRLRHNSYLIFTITDTFASAGGYPRHVDATRLF